MTTCPLDVSNEPVQWPCVTRVAAVPPTDSKSRSVVAALPRVDEHYSLSLSQMRRKISLLNFPMGSIFSRLRLNGKEYGCLKGKSHSTVCP